MSEKESPRGGAAKPKVSTKTPETTEDLVAAAVDRGGLDEVVRLLRDWCGSGEIWTCRSLMDTWFKLLSAAEHGFFQTPSG